MNHHDGSSVANRAYEHIRSGLVCGDYPAGRRLVTRRLAQELGTSLNPVREALGRLAAEGLVDHVPGAGAFVRTLTPEEILELYELRQAIEPFAVRKAARSITEPELAALRELCAVQHRLAHSLRGSGGHLEGEDLDRWLATEERFHETLIRAARNRHFERALAHSRVLTRIFLGHRSLGVRVDLGTTARTWRFHKRLVEALERGDGDAAAASMHESLLRGAQAALTATHEPRD